MSGEGKVDDLLSALNEEKGKRWSLRRVRLVKALGRLGDSRAVEPLARVVSVDPSYWVRLMAVIALGQIGDPAGAQVLRKEASSSYAGDQMWALHSLGMMRDDGSVPLLIERLRSTDSTVRRFAAYALGDIGDRAATLPLIGMLDDADVRRAAATALARLGDPRALDPVRLAHRSVGGLARRRIGRSLAKLEASSESDERSKGDTGSRGIRGLLADAFERWLVPFVLMACAVWDGITIKSKKQRLAEAIHQGERLCFTARDKPEASAFLKKAVQEFPEDPHIRELYASTLMGVRPDDVRREAAKAVELGPDDPVVLVRAGHLFHFAEQWDDMRSCVARANELAGPDFAMKAGLDNLNGILAGKDHEYERAEELLRSATEEGQVHAIDLVKFLRQQKRDAEALEVVDEALKHVENKSALKWVRTEIVEGRYLAD